MSNQVPIDRVGLGMTVIVSAGAWAFKGAKSGVMAGSPAGLPGAVIGGLIGSLTGLAGGIGIGIASWLWRYNGSQQHQPRPEPISPLILDLNRDGRLKLDNWTYFDYNNTGFAELATWIDKDDAFLVLDLNGDGIINNGSEMFGTSTMLPNGMLALDGWHALRQYDVNGDGKIDINDDIFGSLMVLTGDGRLASLAEAGIKSITIPPLPPGGPAADPTVRPSGFWSWTLAEQNQYLIDQARARDAEILANGGVYWGSSVFEWEDGTTSEIVDAYPYRVPMYSIATEWLEVPEDIAALPDLVGFGNKHDLHQAMIRDESGELRALVEQYMAEKDQAAREKIFVDILYKWAGVDGVDPGSRGGRIDARQVEFLEKYFGEEFVGVSGANPNNEAAPKLRALFDDIARSMEMSLLAQTHLKPLFENMGYDFTEPVLDENGKIIAQGILNISLDPAIKWLGELARTDKKAA